jgi:hypothetical protein
MQLRIIGLAALAAAGLPCPAWACSICGGDLKGRQTLRQEAAAARVIVFGTLSNARLTPGAAGGDGQTDFKIRQTLKGADSLKGTATLTLPRYLPGDGKESQRGVFFFDLRGDRLILLGGRAGVSEQVAAYVKEIDTLAHSAGPALLEFYLRRLDHPDPDVAADAFIELARGSDADLARCARAIAPERLRRLLTSPATPRERIGLCAFLLALAGSEKDAELLSRLLSQAPVGEASMRRGLLIGYTILKPAEGWRVIHKTLGENQREFLERHAVFGALEFFYNWQPRENRERILLGMKLAVQSAELADLAAEDLRRWRWWDLTGTVLAQYDRPGYDSPIVRRAILRYALACPEPAASQFVAGVRKRDPALVTDVLESLSPQPK